MEDQLTDWAKGMVTLIENEQYRDLVTMLDKTAGSTKNHKGWISWIGDR